MNFKLWKLNKMGRKRVRFLGRNEDVGIDMRTSGKVGKIRQDDDEIDGRKCN